MLPFIEYLKKQRGTEKAKLGHSDKPFCGMLLLLKNTFDVRIPSTTYRAAASYLESGLDLMTHFRKE